MNGEAKFWICIWSLAAIIILAITASLFVSERQEKAALTERMTVCIKEGGEWRPMMLPGSQTTYLSCVRPGRV